MSVLPRPSMTRAPRGTRVPLVGTDRGHLAVGYDDGLVLQQAGLVHRKDGDVGEGDDSGARRSEKKEQGGGQQAAGGRHHGRTTARRKRSA